jgi:hypothetical protein
MIAELIVQYGAALIAAAFAAIAAFVGRSFVEHSFLRSMLERIVIEARAVVLEVEQTYVDKITEGRRDGILTPEEGASAKAAAIAKLRTNLGSVGLERLGRIIGLTAPAIEALLGTHVEAAVKSLTLAQEATPVITVPAAMPLMLPPPMA